MANGDITRTSCNTAIQMLTAATATNSTPSGASAGVAIKDLVVRGVLPETATVLVVSTAGSGTMTSTLRLWGYHEVSTAWVPLGTGTDPATTGTLNAGTALAEDEANSLRHCEPVTNIATFDRLYLEIVAIGGTATALSAWLVVANDRYNKNYDAT